MGALRQARDLPSSLRPFLRPRRHPYSTFEGQIPSRFPALAVDPVSFVTERPSPRKKNGKPDLFCVFCKRIKKPYDTIAGLWSHIVHKHDGIDTSARLEEIHRIAAQWRFYLDNFTDGGERGQRTRKRLEELQEPGFDWNRLLDWNLRG